MEDEDFPKFTARIPFQMNVSGVTPLGRLIGSLIEEEALQTKRGVNATICALRSENGWSQTELARRAGCTSAHINFLEHGKREPSLPMLRRIANALGLTLAEFIEEADRRAPGAQAALYQLRQHLLQLRQAGAFAIRKPRTLKALMQTCPACEE